MLMENLRLNTEIRKRVKLTVYIHNPRFPLQQCQVKPQEKNPETFISVNKMKNLQVST